MPRGNPSAAQRARDARARAEGFRNYYDKRSAQAKLRGYQGGYSEQRRRRAEGTASRQDAAFSGASRRQIHAVAPGVTIVTTTPGGGGWSVIERQLERRPGEPVRAVVYWIDAEGDQHEGRLWAHGASAAWVLDGARADGWTAFLTDQLTDAASTGHAPGDTDDPAGTASENPPVAIIWAGFTIGGGWGEQVAA